MYKVLLVNDCKLENFIMRDMLISLGHEVIISNEFDAVREARELNCNAIIANFIMKEKTGDIILQQIKHMYPQTKCILSSSNDIRLEDLNRKVIDGFIRTPVTKEKLEKVMETNSKKLNEQMKILKPLFCIYCGQRLDVSDGKARFCGHCGGEI